MKKLLGILMILPLLLASCSDDDLPNVKFTLNYEGATTVDGTLYVVKGQTLAFTGIYVTPVNTAHKAVIAGATYYWDWINAGTTIVEPFGRAFDTSLYSVGPHMVQILCPVLEVDCTPANATLNIPIVIVEDAADIPQGDNPGGDNNSGEIMPEAIISNAD